MIKGKDIYLRASILRFVVTRSLVCPPPELFTQINSTDVEKESFDKEFGNIFIGMESDMKKLGLFHSLSQQEKEWFSMPLSAYSQYPRVASLWRKEALAVLLWSMGIEESLSVEIEYSQDQFNRFVPKKLGLFEKIQTRPKAEIEKQRSIYELWHWRIRTQKMIDDGYDFKPTQEMQQQGIKTLNDIVRTTAEFALEDGSIRKIIDEDFAYNEKAFRDLSDEERSIATSIIIERHYGLNWVCGYADKNNWDLTPTDT